MLDTTPVTSAITRLIAAGTTEDALLIAVAYLFPNLTLAELSAALQVATTEAERKVAKPRH
jgi:uncharacterized protein (DUF433 family)